MSTECLESRLHNYDEANEGTTMRDSYDDDENGTDE